MHVLRRTLGSSELGNFSQVSIRHICLTAGHSVEVWYGKQIEVWTDTQNLQTKCTMPSSTNSAIDRPSKADGV
jgi:hypothetical protein